MTPAFRPTLYLNIQCPFCLKVRIFLLEAHLEDSVELVEFASGSPEEGEIRQLLAPRFGKVTFPAAQLGPGEYITDSDAIIARLAAAAGTDPATLPVLRRYGDAALGRIVQLFRDNAELNRLLA